jgi:hypothetical protein
LLSQVAELKTDECVFKLFFHFIIIVINSLLFGFSQPCRVADIHLGNFGLLFVSLYQVLVKLKFLAFFGLLKIAVFLLPIAIDQVFGPFCGFELFIGFIANLVVIVV